MTSLLLSRSLVAEPRAWLLLDNDWFLEVSSFSSAYTEYNMHSTYTQ